MLHRDRLYASTHRANPFLTLVEPVRGFTTVWTGDDHNRIIASGRVRQIAGPPRWLRVAHERTVGTAHLQRERRVSLAGLAAFRLGDRWEPEARLRPAPGERLRLAAERLWGRLVVGVRRRRFRSRWQRPADRVTTGTRRSARNA